MTARAAVGIDDDLAAGQAGVAHGPADDEAAGGIDVVLGVLVEPRCGQHGLDDVLEDVGVELFVADALGVLAGDDHRVDAGGLAVLVVLDRDLALAVGAQIRQLAVLAHRGQLAAELVGQRDGGRHQLGGLIGGIAEHHALVAGAAGVHTLGDVARLLVDGRDHGAGVRVEAVECVVVADGGNHAAHQGLEIDVGLGGDFAGDDHQAGGRQRLGGNAAVGVLLQAGIENSVGDLVGNLVGMAFGHGFRGKQKTVAQVKAPPIAGNSIWAACSEDRYMLGHRRGEQEHSLPHRTHSRTEHASTVRLAPWDASFYGNCHAVRKAKNCSEWRRGQVQCGCESGLNRDLRTPERTE